MLSDNPPTNKTEILNALQDEINHLNTLPCTFFACNGPDKDKVEYMATCSNCWTIHDLRIIRDAIRAHLMTTPRPCPECKGKGENMTGIGMLHCNDCSGSGQLTPR